MAKKEKIIIVGAGLCGSLLGLRLAQRGYSVCIYEKRKDLRTEEEDVGRSINLALSNRGLKALAQAGITSRVRDICIPMKGRIIHSRDGNRRMSPYSGREGDYINSVSRGGLNALLLDEADRFDDVQIYFEHDCQRVDLKEGRVIVRDLHTGETHTESASVVIGTDGAGSVVRRSMMAQTTDLLFNYSQDFLRHGYKELSILPTDEGDFRMEKNGLHIWPRGAHMIIALPNLDASFTVTMFHPFEGDVGFHTLDTKARVRRMFEEEYPELIELMPHFEEEYFSNPTGTLGTIKCYPWQAYGRCLIMGDASHAIVPFYGQGMNASFEDVLEFDRILDEGIASWEEVFMRFQDVRKENTDAIADLAVDNFFEMRDYVDDENFMRKRQLEMQLEQQFPQYYSKYSMVTFLDEMPYKEAMDRGRRQDALLLKMCAERLPEDLGAVLKTLEKEIP